jgi:aspartyl-tRNA synthetase
LSDDFTGEGEHMRLKRTHYCNNAAEIGQEVTVSGFVRKIRDLGNLIFIDLRDRSGIIQLAFDDETPKDVFALAASCRSEFVVSAKGTVSPREAVNKDIPTGNAEITVRDFEILSKAQTPPFEIRDDANVKEELKLKYRYLDLRRGVLQRNLIVRHEIAKISREYFYKHDFIEIETPMLIKSTPEGARDYLVPSRVHPGKHYALPQSPQIYKQLLMVAGMERYFQIARCFRDEDLRADRQPEFAQIDIEMSYADVDDILEITEGFIAEVFKKVLGIDIPLPLPRMPYAEAMRRFGTDKPDTRFGMEIVDLTETVRDCGFGVFKTAVENNGSVRAVNAKDSAGVLTRKEIDKLTETARGLGAGGLAFIRWNKGDAAPVCPFAKFLTEQEMHAILTQTDCHEGDTVLFVADKDALALSVAGALRLIVGQKLDIIPDGYNFLWITEFPFFDYDVQSKQWVAMHHPFTMPDTGQEDFMDLLDKNKADIKAKAYDLVLNGTELSSGSIRITDYELQQKMFEMLGLTPEEIETKFGFLVDAYKYGAPPHGGLAIGLDRLAMIICGADSLRDVTAFPKVQNASELMSGCPS